MKFRVVITANAREEEAESYLYYEGKLEGLGERFLIEVESVLQQIAENPTFYSYCDFTGTIRDVALAKFPFTIIYEIQDDNIIITNIHHVKKDLK